ncbi:FAD binding domain-containing protein [Sporosarcina thermotolerans]|uniref:FAD binding domain-containing protein n=1 Tax=Sporosarcina thermotolerans TaxID=633404 RepID=A0AAW9A8T7_9BACL|nr:FAD binding domain-containing protein [Sporosarcina thermotolerans]MDW0116061.1 FAD binding domain-containing protein [Sporosarcina thermotolerans]WHT49985.1 FAD binding domain-containing protein [Sporosarcina thermotolerans]
MIPFNFEYHKPSSISKAVKIYRKLYTEGKKPLFYNGGTEIITMSRINGIETKAVIDIKEIKECNEYVFRNNQLVLGSSLPLAKIEEMNDFPLLSKNCSRIADHTARVKITLGGNISGHIKYKEAVLPLLLTDSDLLVVGGEYGQRQVSIHEAFNRKINLMPGEFIAQILVSENYLKLPFVSKKETRIDRISYPLLTVSAIKIEDQIRIAISGLCDFPFRSTNFERELNRKELPIEERIMRAIKNIPAPILNDLHGSADYRQFVLYNTLEETILELKGEKK